MGGQEICEERHGNCEKRMDSHARDIREKVPWRVFYWTLGLAFVLIFSSYGYTSIIAGKVSEVVTKQDMQQYQDSIIKAIREN